MTISERTQSKTVELKRLNCEQSESFITKLKICLNKKSTERTNYLYNKQLSIKFCKKRKEITPQVYYLDISMSCSIKMSFQFHILHCV